MCFFYTIYHIFRILDESGIISADNIIPNNEETLDGLIAAIKEARVHNLL